MQHAARPMPKDMMAAHQECSTCSRVHGRGSVSQHDYVTDIGPHSDIFTATACHAGEMLQGHTVANAPMHACQPTRTNSPTIHAAGIPLNNPSALLESDGTQSSKALPHLSNSQDTGLVMWLPRVAFTPACKARAKPPTMVKTMPTGISQPAMIQATLSPPNWGFLLSSAGVESDTATAAVLCGAAAAGVQVPGLLLDHATSTQNNWL